MISFIRYFMNVLGAVSEEVNEIELTADGNWRIPVSETNTEKGRFFFFFCFFLPFLICNLSFFFCSNILSQWLSW